MTPSRLSPGDADALLFDLGRVVFDIDFPKALACWAGHARCEPADIAARFVTDESYQHHERGTPATCRSPLPRTPAWLASVSRRLLTRRAAKPIPSTMAEGV